MFLFPKDSPTFPQRHHHVGPSPDGFVTVDCGSSFHLSLASVFTALEVGINASLTWGACEDHVEFVPVKQTVLATQYMLTFIPCLSILPSRASENPGYETSSKYREMFPCQLLKWMHWLLLLHSYLSFPRCLKDNL